MLCMTARYVGDVSYVRVYVLYVFRMYALYVCTFCTHDNVLMQCAYVCACIGSLRVCTYVCYALHVYVVCPLCMCV